MANINETDFFKGALWAADILLSTSHCAGANDEVRDILEHIPNLYSVVMRTPETEVHDLRLYADKEFPLGLNAEYTAISIAPLKDFFDILPVTDHELDCEAMDIETWGVVADLANGKKDLLIAGLLTPETAKMYADRLSEQLEFQQKKAS
ncbi:hypothetical protein M5X66_08635 [Providencia sp. PROV188]|uniref:hypothetical protein n=1 Tax=Providencia TaxID=586 RepID=UPI00055B4F87|nr:MULTISPECIES: hypothetical protein [Providencia]MBG5882197.1 hypothetical protein [Providencia alcalifaciens]MTB47244.1 hypothetical protein [Providencia sp. wls1950]MTC21529.1 hypothetical protein [Providencia sp. wls1938]MTC43759.1 hypothetical protein [Providencia sp. wls1921]MTC44648.1 hypothetical protein [Providencia sp. wls1922]